MLGAVWVIVSWFWPNWRVWAACLAGYVLLLIALHASIVFRLPAGGSAEHWMGWMLRETPLFLLWAALNALVVVIRQRLRAAPKQ